MENLKKLFLFVKNEYWPYRYYLLMIILFYLTWEKLTIARILRFVITIIVILIYKYIHVYINTWNVKTFNIKYLNYLMNLNIVINPILYLVWMWDIKSYKIKNFLNLKLKNKKVKTILIALIMHITTPIKYAHIRFYKMLTNFQSYKIFELLFIRIYGLMISVLIFSDLINYLLDLSGGIVYFMIYIYLIIYIINVTYTCYIWGEFELKIKWLKKMYIFTLLLNYFKSITSQVTLAMLHNSRINITLTGSIIKKHLNYNLKNPELLEHYIYKIPSIWRYSIHWWLLNSGNVVVYGNSYIESKNTSIIYDNTLENVFYNLYYIDIYSEIFFQISDIFILMESILYWKYWNKKKIVDLETYQYALDLYYLIVKNILHFMWSFEYSLSLDKNKISRLYINLDSMVTDGYNIFFNEKCNCGEIPDPLYKYADYSKYVKSDKVLNNKILNNEKYEEIYESIYLLINLCDKDWWYVEYPANIALKNLNRLHLKYHKLFQETNNSGYTNDLDLLEKAEGKAYLLELNNLMQNIKNDWESRDPLDIFEKRTVFVELVNHIKKHVT